VRWSAWRCRSGRWRDEHGCAFRTHNRVVMQIVELRPAVAAEAFDAEFGF
jgi:hypothetical protein